MISDVKSGFKVIRKKEINEDYPEFQSQSIAVPFVYPLIYPGKRIEVVETNGFKIEKQQVDWFCHNFNRIWEFVNYFGIDFIIAHRPDKFKKDMESRNQAMQYLLEHYTHDWSISPTHYTFYSESFYSSKNISWGFKPEGSMRVSDHWNFTLDYQENKIIHAPTEDGELGHEWALGIYHNGKYQILRKF